MPLDTKEALYAGPTGGPALPSLATTSFLRGDGNYAAPVRKVIEPAGIVGSTVLRKEATSTSAAMTSGTVYVTAVDLDMNITVRNISLFVTTAEATGTHAWVGLSDSGGNVLAISADNTGAAYYGPVNTAITTALGTAYTTPAPGLYYIFVCVAATTMPVFSALAAFANSALANVAPIACGSALTGQTTPVAVASSLGAFTATANHVFYAWLT